MPTGWHIPTYAELQTLSTAVNNNGNSLKAIGQGDAMWGGAGTNTSGFSALLAGYRILSGDYPNLGYITGFWSSTEYNPATYAYYVSLYSTDSNINFYGSWKGSGLSVDRK